MLRAEVGVARIAAWCLLLVPQLAFAGTWVQPTNERNFEVLVPDGVRVVTPQNLVTAIDGSGIEMRFAKAFVRGAPAYLDEVKRHVEFAYQISGASLADRPACTTGDIEVCSAEVRVKTDAKHQWLLIVATAPGGSGVSVLVTGTPEERAAHAAILDQVRTGFRPIVWTEEEIAAAVRAANPQAAGPVATAPVATAPPAPPAPEPAAVPGRLPGPCAVRTQLLHEDGRVFEQSTVMTWEGSRLTRETEDLGGGTLLVNEYIYDDAGRLSRVLRDGIVDRELTYDERGVLRSESAYGGYLIEYQYEGDQLVRELVDDGGAEPMATAHTWKDGRKVGTKHDFGSTYEYEYDAAGNLSRETEITNPIGKGTPSRRRRVEWTYDGAGNPLVARSAEQDLADPTKWAESSVATYDYACWAEE